MPEASEDRPGHVGHTPQDVRGIQLRARIASYATDPVVQQTARVEYAMQTFPEIQSPTAESTLQTVQQMQQQASKRQFGKFPGDFFFGLLRGTGVGQ